MRRLPEHLEIDGLSFSVRVSARRRTIGVSVSRDGALALAAPARCGRRELERAVRTKLPWVRRKLAEQAALGPAPPPRRYAPGERAPYLGREHPIVAGDDGCAGVRLRGGRFELPGGAADGDQAARALFVAWYIARLEPRAAALVACHAAAVGDAPDALVVRDLGRRRWGVCDARRRLVTLHWELATLPPDLIEYVVVHELAHLREPNHQRPFWELVEQVLPDWRERRRRLSRLARERRPA